MVGTSKILTVSYGTFSCTLEGFDDSFNTMKAIAEYFRDLASDDRYFGAEPPSPDAEMLARIAEREISRRVDASMDDSGITLRAAALADGSAETDTHDAESRAKVEAERKAAKAARKAEKAAAKARERAEKKAAEEKAELERAEAEKKSEAAKQAEADKQAEAEASEALAAQAEDETTDNIESEGDATADTSEGTAESDVEETRDDASSSTLAASDLVPENTAEDEAPAEPDTNSVAAKLRRIRAVVGKSDATDDEMPSDDMVEEFFANSNDDGFEDAETFDETDDSAFETGDTSEDVMSQIMDRAKSDDASDTDTQNVRTRILRLNNDDDAKADTDADKADAVEDAVKKAAGVSDATDFGLLDGADELDEYLEDADTSEESLDLDSLDIPQEEERPRRRDTFSKIGGLIDSGEDATTPEVAETDDQDEAPQDDIAAEDDAAEEATVDDAAMDRLMSETDAKLKEPEGSRRRDAIAQLKAAVAAKEAERQMGAADKSAEDVENAFRNDLSNAVAPEKSAKPKRRVIKTELRTERPVPAPLKLVPAQRVDVEDADATPEEPVAPRRVMTRLEEPKTAHPAGSFAEFADNMGAKDLSDLLEAAAAYTSFIEGADEFSRPQILRRVRSIAAADFKREDELRSFADLITAGRFTKVRNGRFQVADDSRFNPERRAS